MPLKIGKTRRGVGIRVLDKLRANLPVILAVGLLAVATTI
jgi:hypothetical protein